MNIAQFASNLEGTIRSRGAMTQGITVHAPFKFSGRLLISKDLKSPSGILNNTIKIQILFNVVTA